MRILIEKVQDGDRRITVLPRHGAHMAPIQVRGRDEATVTELLLAAIVDVWEREGPAARAAPQGTD